MGNFGGYDKYIQSNTVRNQMERTAQVCLKSITYQRLQNYEPRGRGFDSCQPHQQVSPESEKTQGFFLWDLPKPLLSSP